MEIQDPLAGFIESARPNTDSSSVPETSGSVNNGAAPTASTGASSTAQPQPGAPPTPMTPQQELEQMKSTLESEKAKYDARIRAKDSDIDRRINNKFALLSAQVQTDLQEVKQMLAALKNPPQPEGYGSNDPQALLEQHLGPAVDQLLQNKYGLTPQRVAMTNIQADAQRFVQEHPEANQLGFIFNPMLVELSQEGITPDYKVMNAIYRATIRMAQMAAENPQAFAGLSANAPPAGAGTGAAAPTNNSPTQPNPTDPNSAGRQDALRKNAAMSSTAQPGVNTLSQPKRRKWTIKDLQQWPQGIADLPSES